MPHWYRPASGAWNGVNLGGWLILEPGPSEPLFNKHPDKNGQKATCEWDLMQILRFKKDTRSISKHRRSFITKDDFERIRACGLNAVRLPFGYWCVLGPSGDEPYEGPCLEIIDQALDWAEELGLQVLLDLHGCPGGESGEPPSGRVHKAWHWRQWRVGQSLQALKVVALRYKDRKCVTGIAVCNEPSGDVPISHMVRYYDRAVELVRKCGMRAKQVTVVLPLWQKEYAEFIKSWTSFTKGRHRHVCFEDHFYQCMDDYSHGLTFAQHLRGIQDSIRDLRKYPMVIGEWSLALGQNAWNTPLAGDELLKQYGRMQMEAYKAASHGWFFWTWKDGKRPEWDYQEAFKNGCFSGPAPTLPSWNGKGEDPLEDEFNPICSGDKQIRFGDSIFIRSFSGCCMDARECKVRVQFPDTQDWQRFTLHSPQGASEERRQILHGDVVRLCSHTDRFLYASEDGQLSARLDRVDLKGLSEFIACTSDKRPLQHRKVIFLKNRATSCMVDICDKDDVVRVRSKKFGDYQRWIVEKDLESLTQECNKNTPLKKRSKSQQSVLDEADMTTLSKVKKRRLSSPSKSVNLIIDLAQSCFEVTVQVAEHLQDKALKKGQS